jgi:hypothetical protein
MIKKLIVFVMIVAGYCLFSCEGIGPCAGYDDFWEMGLDFQLYDKKTNKNLLGIYGKYHLDSVKIYDEQGKAVFDKTVELSGYMAFEYLDRQTDLVALNAPLTKTYYLHLGPSPYDVDTIAILFKLQHDRCDRERFEYVQVFYNDSLYYEGNGGLYNNRIPPIDFYK